MHLCGGQTHVHQWVGWQANLMLPSPLKLALPSSCCSIACFPALRAYTLLAHAQRGIIIPDHDNEPIRVWLWGFHVKCTHPTLIN